MSSVPIPSYIGRVLAASGVVGPDQIHQALALCAREPLSLVGALARLGFATEEALAAAISKKTGAPLASRANKILIPQTRDDLHVLIPESLARKHEVLPLFVRGGSLAAAMADPTDTLAIFELMHASGLVVTVFVAAPSELKAAIDEFYLKMKGPAAVEDVPQGAGPRDRLVQGGGAGDASSISAGSSPAAFPGVPAAHGRGSDGSAPGFMGRLSGWFSGSAEPERDLVDCSVFAPREAAPKSMFLVQVFAHQPQQDEAVREAAAEADSDSRKAGTASLGTRIARESRLDIELKIPGLSIPEPVRSIVWLGRPSAAQFDVQVPETAAGSVLIGTVNIAQDSVPIGCIKFKLAVSQPGTAVRPTVAPVGEARRFSMAFVSYASNDRAEVLRRVQMLPAAGIRFFQDVMDLEPGDRWSQQLYKKIDESDVMFLFWSGAAKNSEWVEKEWRYALEKKGTEFIRPVILEGPGTAPPPEALSALHFNDKILYFIKGSQ